MGDSATDLHAIVRRQVAQSVGASAYPDFTTVLRWGQFAPESAPTDDRAWKDLLPLWACLAVGGEVENALGLAAAFKLCILAAIVADDLADQDHPERPWHTWSAGRGTQVCLSLLLAAQTCLAELPTPVAAPIIRDLGQALQLAVAGQAQPPQATTFEAYYRHALAKSGLVFGGFARAGAMLGSPEGHHHQALFDYGMALGAIAQIQNDCHDMTCATVTAERIPYLLPVLIGIEVPHPQQAALRALLQPPLSAERWPAVQALLGQINVTGYVARILKNQAQRALQTLLQAELYTVQLEHVLDLEMGSQ